MINYLLINIILSSSALAINQWLQIPHRLRFYGLIIAVISWLIPFGFFNIQISRESVATWPAQVVEFNQPISAVNQVIEKQFDFKIVFGVLMVAGLFLFIRDLLLSQQFIKKLKPTSTLLNRDQQIRFTENINGAFVSGYFKPTIWISQNFSEKETLQTIISHEKQHIKSHDQFWLLIITFMQRLMWFNPLMYLLSNKTRQAIELSCDEACKQQMGTTKYQTHLAQIILNNSQHQDTLLHNTINHNKNFNINRIKQLNQENQMSKHNTSKLLFIAVLATFMSSFTLVTVAKDAAIPTIKDNQVLLTLKIQNGNTKPKELSILTNQGERANVTYDNHDFGFTTQVMPNEPTQIYSDIVISQISNGVKTEISNPGIVTTNSKWGGFKFGKGENYFDIEIMAQTSSQLDPVVEAVDKFIELNDPIPAVIEIPKAPQPPIDTNEAMPNPATPPEPKSTPSPAAAANPIKPPQPATAESVPQPKMPPQPIKPVIAPTPSEVKQLQ